MREFQRSLVVALILAMPAAAGGVDLTGKWRFEVLSGGDPEITDVTQTGDSLSFTLFTRPFSGSVTQGSPFSTWMASFSEGPFDGILIVFNGRITPSGNLMDATVGFIVPPLPPGKDGLIATRCTCDDDNTADGDGCSADCQVEPCWTCTGDPSMCTPSSDGSVCGTVCTTGQTCSAGVCGGGTTVSPCVDMTGLWLSNGNVAGQGPYAVTTNIVQRGTDVIFRDPSFGAPRVAGTIDPATGAFDLRIARVDFFCQSFDTLLGSATSLTYTAAGNAWLPRPSQPDVCDPHAWTETGSRCGTGTVDSDEACDDGDLIGGDGCSATCTVEPCWQCSGSPSVCVRAPRTPCKSSTVPAKSRLSIKNVADHHRDKLLWRWKKGEDTTLAELGDPVGADDYLLCVFDESSPTPSLLFPAAAPAGPACDGSSCWAATGRPGFSYRNKSALPEGVIKVRLKSGTGGAAQIQVKGKGIHMSDRPVPLPALPLPLPLRVQLQGANGFCAETWHDASSVQSNGPSQFNARGTTAP